MSRSFIALLVLAIASCASAFLQSGAARTMLKAGALSMKMEMPKSLAAMAPALIALPAFASTDVITSMPLAGLEVSFAAYLAVLLGTFVPVTFLIVLYSQSEARKQGLRNIK
ncbi:hypothetical protein B484DRAFT_444450 [Ochromonadaceae sp. CCMP2298]|nr:hypothetical protein B484DRAFT_444450 [Ochromonadaceae sp. CCMP2298]|eukprot:CAMPEP_0173171812 /NCGR_PEP_ID=MMETSP1141-20130122/1964_1 /TAXON_ID=483371 /ORGANISM="non described non described, Strain CCMP2298" /LENGTH=111 /DNA_ID=CAMNT_0014093785 /DNA_START=38 /DNA_END=373 /DNA_ORIENTATION=+